jgi:alanyl-tRNA synthetase
VYGELFAFAYNVSVNFTYVCKAGKNAGADVREAAKLVMGGGGGQPGLATAGGKNLEGLAAALAKMIESAVNVG